MKPITKTLFLPIEIIARELDSKLLIAHKATKKGYSVVIGTKGPVYKIARAYGSGIYFYKDHSPISSLMLQELKFAGLKIVAMDEEGLSWPSPKIYTKRIDDKVLEISDAIFVWGQKQFDILTTRTSPGNKKNIHIVGNPRFDILHSKYFKYLRDQSKYQLSLFEDGYILINSMFTPGNWNPFLYGTPSYVEHMLDRGLITNDEDLIFYTKVSENAAQLFEAYVSLLKNLSKSFPDTKFVIRPHPDENQEKWHNLFSSENNVFVENKGSAIYWILGAKALVSSGCTTAIEAWAMNKPTLRFHPIPETEYGPYLPNHFGKTIKTEEELVEEIRIVLSDQEYNRFDVDPEYVQSYIKNVFSADATENIIQVLDSFYNGDENNISMISLRGLKKKTLLLLRFDIKKRLRSRVLGKIKRILQKKDTEKELKVVQAKSQKFSGLTRENIESRLISLDNIEGLQSNKNWDIVELSPNTFKILYK